jgi:uncharacterized protein YndB with AHSA1/START domain
MPDEHAVLLERDGRYVLRFERALGHSRERVWRALTERAGLEAWHPTPFLLEDGATIAYLPSPGLPELEAGRVLACEAPSLLVHTWFEDELRWTLEDLDGGCLLTLEHSFDDRFKAARDGAGWHTCLVALAHYLGEGALAQRGSPQQPPDGWSELNAEYQRRFEITPGDATPIPRM